MIGSTFVASEALKHFFILPGAITHDENEALDRYLSSLPILSEGEVDRKQQFAFARPVYDGVEVTARAEAAAGDPIWVGERFVRGVSVPVQLMEALGRANRAVSEIPYAEVGVDPPEAPLSSVYVDWYELGSFFVPHTDRVGYGPVVAGLSVGKGVITMRWSDGGVVHDVVIEPRSLYLFCGPIRYEPWTHSVIEVTDRRFGITMRSRGAGHSQREESP